MTFKILKTVNKEITNTDGFQFVDTLVLAVDVTKAFKNQYYFANDCFVYNIDI